MVKRNPHTGSRFDAFLKDEGIYGGVQARALGRALAEHVAETKGHRGFLDAAALTEVAMQESGVGYAMPQEAHANVQEEVRGEQMRRPGPVKRRK